MLHITDQNFDTEVLKAKELVVVDFWTEWCYPCKALGPVIEALATEYEGKIKIAKMNVDENPNVPQEHGIMSIPTMIFFKGGQVVDQIVGAVPKGAIKEKIEKHI